MRSRHVGAIGISLGLLASAPAVAGAAQASSAASTQVSDTLRACAHLQGQVFRVCVAYLGNASTGARLPFYMLGRSPNRAQVQEVTDWLEKRYVGAARQLIKGQTAV